MEIIDFKNFEQFQAYIKQHGEKMPQWSFEETKQFTDKVSKLREESPEFKEKYDQWIAQMEIREKIKRHKGVVIGGTEQELVHSQAYLKLKRKQTEKADKGSKLSIAEIAKRKKQYTI